MRATVPRHGAPSEVHGAAWPLARAAVPREERLAARPGEEAQVLRVRCARDRQPLALGEVPHLRLRQLPEREPHPRDAGWRECGEHVRLVLRRVGGRADQAVVRDARVVAGGQVRRAQAAGEVEHGVEPHVAVAAHARVRGEAGGVIGDPRVDDAGAKRVAQVERDVRQAHPVREPSRVAHRARRAAGALGVVVRVAPQLERDGDRLRPVLVRAEQRGDRAVDPSGHRDERAAGIRLQARVGADRRAECLRERVGRKVRRVALAQAQAAERPGDLLGADPRGVEDRGAIDQFDRGAGGGDRRPAALGVEAGAADDPAADREVDAHDVTAGAAPRRRGVRPGGHAPASAREAQVVFEALVRHPAGV